MSRGSQALQLAGIVAAVVLAAIGNVLSARHFARWDWTRDKRWSLSPATTETLASLETPVDIWAIAGPGDPMEKSLHQLLVAYAAGSSRVALHVVDPDRDAVQLIDLERRYGLEAGRAENGRVATDAVVIVAAREKHWFLTPADLFESVDEVHARPKEERALTQAIREVLGGAKAKLCFTLGHGELALDAGRDPRDNLGALRTLLEKSNYELASIDTAAQGVDPLAGCSVVVIAGMRTAFTDSESARLRAWLGQGGGLLAAIGPTEGEAGTEGTTGLEQVLSPFGIALDDQLVHDLDPPVAIPDTHGEGYFVTPRPHPTTAALLAGAAEARPPRIAIFFARSLHHAAGPIWASDLLVTSAQAFAKKNVAGANAWPDAPAPEPSDPKGPFVVAMAAERPGTAAEGGRVVVIGSRFALMEDNWRQPGPLHGTAFFVEAALSWLAARPAVVDVPDRAEVAAGVRVSEAGRLEVERYVLLFMPLAALLLGIAVWAWRASSENKTYAARAAGGDSPE